MLKAYSVVSKLVPISGVRLPDDGTVFSLEYINANLKKSVAYDLAQYNA